MISTQVGFRSNRGLLAAAALERLVVNTKDEGTDKQEKQKDCTGQFLARKVQVQGGNLTDAEDPDFQGEPKLTDEQRHERRQLIFRKRNADTVTYRI